MQETRIVLASRNEGKIRELREILKGITVLSLSDINYVDDIEEGEVSFEENALAKARAAWGACGLLTLADDSGLAVDALGGEPGVLSARYAGEKRDDSANNRKLLSRLEGVPEGGRGARFVCVAAAVTPDGDEYAAMGTAEGHIAFDEEGDGGFGYDPLFFSDELGKRFSQASMEEKNQVSHRARAFGQLIAMLKKAGQL